MTKEAPILDYQELLRIKNAVNNTFDVRQGDKLLVDPATLGELIFILEQHTVTETPAEAAGVTHLKNNFQKLKTPEELPPSQYQEAITIFEELKDPDNEQPNLDKIINALRVRKKTAKATALEFPPRQSQEVDATVSSGNVNLDSSSPQPVEHKRAIGITAGAFTVMAEVVATTAGMAGSAGDTAVCAALGLGFAAVGARLIEFTPFKRNKQKGKNNS